MVRTARVAISSALDELDPVAVPGNRLCANLAVLNELNAIAVREALARKFIPFDELDPVALSQGVIAERTRQWSRRRN
jgi:hypothetical protein